MQYQICRFSDKSHPSDRSLFGRAGELVRLIQVIRDMIQIAVSSGPLDGLG